MSEGEIIMAKKQKKDKGYKTSSLIIASFGYGAAQIFNFIYQQFAPLILDAKLSNLGNVVLSATIVSGLTGFIMSTTVFHGSFPPH